MNARLFAVTIVVFLHSNMASAQLPEDYKTPQTETDGEATSMMSTCQKS